MVAFVWAISITLAVVVQAALVPFIAIQGIKPDLLLVITVTAGLLYGKEAGFGTGFFAGLLQDLSSGNVFGLNVIPKIAVGFGFGLAERRVFKDNLFLPALAVAFASLLTGIFVFIFVALQGYFVDWKGALLHTIIPIMLYNTIISIPVHFIFAAVIRKVNERYK